MQPNLSDKSLVSVGSGVTLKDLMYVGAGLGLSIFVWEHVGRQKGINFRPSVGFNRFVDAVSNGFEWLGKYTAIASSFLRYISFGEVQKTLEELLLPLWRLITSPGKFFVGYFEYVKSLDSKRTRVFLGSVILIAVLSFGTYKYRSLDGPLMKSLTFPTWKKA